MGHRRLFLVVNLLLVGLIAASGAYLGWNLLNAPEEQKVPQGVYFDTEYISPTQIRVSFDQLPYPIYFTDIIIKVTAPNGGVSRADVLSNTTAYEQDKSSRSLTRIVVSSTGPMVEGSYFIMIADQGLTVGVWSFDLTYRHDGTAISRGSIIVPDVELTPDGTLERVVLTSPTRMEIGVGMVSPSTAMCYCTVHVIGPQGVNQTIQLNRTSSYDVALGDSSYFVYDDRNNDGLLNNGDVMVVGDDGGVPNGTWKFVIQYRFTGSEIASISFEIN
jgi:hypothetical protein